MRGFLTGMVSGGMVSGLALAIGSLMAPQPAGNTPPATPQTSLSDNPMGPAETIDPQEPSLGDQAPDETAPASVGAAPTGEGLVDVDTQPAGVPETGSAPAVPGGDAGAAGAQPDITTDAPVLPSPQTAGPAAPENEADLSISTDPTQPIAPVADDQDAFIVIDQDALIPLAPDDAEPTETATPTTGTSRLTDAVPVRRSDSAGNATDAAAEATPAEPALVAFAEPFVADGRPLLSIIMIDSDQFGVQPKVLDDLGIQITVAIRASMEDVAARAAQYRAMGHEVVLLSDLPEGAVATDAAVALEASFAAIPEAVALLDAGIGGLGSDRDVIGTALSRLDEDGRGLLVMSGGLNAALRSAEGLDLPRHAVLRDLDGQDQNPQIMRRFLDQAAFRARQDGAVSVLTRLRPDTLSALTVWSGASRAKDVQLAPISAILNGDAE